MNNSNAVVFSLSTFRSTTSWAKARILTYSYTLFALKFRKVRVNCRGEKKATSRFKNSIKSHYLWFYMNNKIVKYGWQNTNIKELLFSSAIDFIIEFNEMQSKVLFHISFYFIFNTSNYMETRHYGDSILVFLNQVTKTIYEPFRPNYFVNDLDFPRIIPIAWI